MRIDDVIVFLFSLFVILSLYAPHYWMRYASMTVALSVVATYCFIIEYETRRGLRKP